MQGKGPDGKPLRHWLKSIDLLPGLGSSTLHLPAIFNYILENNYPLQAFSPANLKDAMSLQVPNRQANGISNTSTKAVILVSSSPKSR